MGWGNSPPILKDTYDKSSSTELKFLNSLYNQGLALPDRAQVNFKDYYISADFVYDNHENGTQSFLFIDGSVHDKESVKEDDHKKRSLLADAGYDVIVWRYDQKLNELMESRKDIFRKVVDNE